MKRFYFAGILALSLMSSCQEEEYLLDNSQVKTNMVITATLSETPTTRTQLSSDFKVLWSANDAISTFNNGKHYKYLLEDGGAGKVTADFIYDPTFGSISGGIETGINKDIYIGVYPFNVNTKVSKSDENYEISTAIPVTQTYAASSFGQDASPMVAVNQYTPEFSFKNVGSMLVMPLKGKGTITSAVLESKQHAIAGSAIVTAVAENNWIPTVNIANGESKIILSCGDGVQLHTEEAIKFYFVLAPGTYEANDLSIKFTDSYGNYFVTEITAENTFERSKSLTFGARTFEAQGTEELDLWIKANASAYMTAERIIPSVNDINVEAWIKNLKDQPNTKALLEEAITYITLKNYKAAYEVLGGIPGFIKDTKQFEANGSYIQKVDYTGASYLVSMLEGIESINDIQSLLDYLNEFEKVYEASGLKNKLDERLGSFSKYIDDYAEELASNDEKAVNAVKIAAKTSIARYYSNSFLGENGSLTKHKSNPKYEEYKTKLIELNSAIDDCSTLGMLETTLSAVNLQEITTEVTEKVNNGTFLKPVYKEVTNTYTFSFNGEDVWEKAKLASDAIIGAAIGTAKLALAGFENINIIERLQQAVDTPESNTAKFLNYLFAQESFMESVKKSLREIVTEIEESSKEDIESSNAAAKEQAINTAIQNALINARVDAVGKIQDEFNATNEANLNNGPWAILKKVLNWQKCVDIFTELKMLDVYNALVKLSQAVDGMITYDRGPIYYNIENFDDYQENVDWWILKFNEEFE